MDNNFTYYFLFCYLSFLQDYKPHKGRTLVFSPMIVPGYIIMSGLSSDYLFSSFLKLLSHSENTFLPNYCKYIQINVSNSDTAFRAFYFCLLLFLFSKSLYGFNNYGGRGRYHPFPENWGFRL